MYYPEVIVWHLMLQWNWSLKKVLRWLKTTFVKQQISLNHLHYSHLFWVVQILWLRQNWHLPNHWRYANDNYIVQVPKDLQNSVCDRIGWHLRNVMNGSHVSSTVYMWPVMYTAQSEKEETFIHISCAHLKTKCETISKGNKTFPYWNWNVHVWISMCTL